MAQLRSRTRQVPVDAKDLARRIDGSVVTPEDEAWDDARQAWNLAVDQRPAAVAIPESGGDVAAIVEFARRDRSARRAAGNRTRRGDRSAPLEDTILVKLHRLRGVTIDAGRRIARVDAGAIWIEVVEAAAAHGLAALAGSSPDVGVVGYTLGGGLSWLAPQARARREPRDGDRDRDRGRHAAPGRPRERSRPVLGDARRRRQLRHRHGARVRAASRYTEVYAGVLWFPVDRAAEVLCEWRDWTEDVRTRRRRSVGSSSSRRSPEIPEPVRGKSFVVVEVDPLRQRGRGRRAGRSRCAPSARCWTRSRRCRSGALGHLHMDPEHPVPGVGDGMACSTPSTTRRSMPLVAGTGRLAAAVGRGAPPRRRDRAAPTRSTARCGSFEAPFLCSPSGSRRRRRRRQAVDATVADLRADLAPWEASHTYLNFAEISRDARTLWTETSYHRLRRIKQAVDPQNLIRSNHELA